MGKADVFTGMSLTEKLIWLKQIKGSGSGEHYEDRTATGNPVIFTTNFAQNAKALSVDFAPKQNLNGYDRPWVGGNGKNLGEWANGYSIASSGKIQANQNRVATINPIKIQSNAQYVVSGVTGTQFIYSILNEDTLVRRKVGIANGSVLDTSGGTDMYVCAFHPNTGGGETKVTVDSCLPQIEIGSAPSSYEPYENICPITGISSIDVVANSVTHEINLGRTAYGGTLNVKTGVLTIDKIKILVSDASMMPEVANGWRAGTNANRIGFAINTALLPRQNDSLDILCNIGYASNNANVNNAFEVGACSLYKGNACMYFRFCVPTSITSVEDAYTFLKNNNCEFTAPLDTPLTYQLTAQQIALLEGENVIATDGDNLSVTYQVKV